MTRTARVGLKNIADATNLSVTTVSRVLSDKTPERFPPETRQRVLDAAERLRYRPNVLAVAARGGRSRTIGVYLPPYDSFWTEVIYGVHDELIDRDHVPLILWPTHIRGRMPPADNGGVPRERISELSQLHRMSDRAVDGYILWPVSSDEAKEYVREIASRGSPVVGIDHEPVPTGRKLTVGTDERECARLVAGHLTDRGHRSVVHLAGPRDLFWAGRRASYFEEQIAACEDAWCVTLPERAPEVTGQALRSLLATDSHVTAVYAATDELARLAVETARSLGLRIGTDFALVSVGDTGFAEGAGITSIRQRPYEIGKAAARMMLAALEDADDPKDRESVLSPDLIVRSSSASRWDRDTSEDQAGARGAAHATPNAAHTPREPGRRETP